MNRTLAIPEPGPATSRWERFCLLSAFLLTGVIAVLLGPLIPELEARWGIDHAQSGSLFLVQFSASSLGAIVSSLNLRRSLVAGYALTAVSLVVLVLGGWPLARLAMAISGFGLGLVITGSNLLVARKNPHRAGAAVATLNVIWGLGAVSGPLLFAAFSQWIGAFGLLRMLAVLALCASAALAATLTNPPGAGHAPKIPHGAPKPTLDPESSGPWLLLLVGALFFFYVGIEISIGGWLVALSDQFSSERSVTSLIIGSGFWGAILVGRANSAILLRRLSETRVYSASLIVAGVGALTLFLAESQTAVAAGALLAGLGLAALFPLNVSILAATTSSNHSQVAGVLMAFGGFGGALLPWLTGQLSHGAGAGAAAATDSLSRGFLVPIVALAALALLFSLYRRITGAQGARPA